MKTRNVYKIFVNNVAIWKTEEKGGHCEFSICDQTFGSPVHYPERNGIQLP
jgi:predicted Rdx family selenoprotein